MGFSLTSPTPEKCDPTAENRVWGFFGDAPKLSRGNRPQSLQPRQGNQPSPTKVASGRAYWPSRDPIEESGGINLYGMVGNDAVGSWDYLGKYNLQPDSGNGPNDNQLKKIKESMERIVKKIEKLEKKMDKIIGCFCKEALSPTTDWTKYRSHPGIGSVLSRLYKTKWVLERVKKGIKGNENLEVELVPLDGGVGGQASTWPGNILDPVMRLQTSGERNWENLSDDGLDEVIFHELTHVAANTVDKSPDGWMGTDPNNAHSLDDIINEDDLCTYFLFYFSLEMIQKSECCKNKVIE